MIEDSALGRPLWHSLWLNVLSSETFESGLHGNPALKAAADTFPWLDPTLLSGGKGWTLPPSRSRRITCTGRSRDAFASFSRDAMWP